MDRLVCILNGVLIALCLVAATMVVSTACRTHATAQVAGEVGSIVATTGPPRPTDDQPLFLADTKNQQVMMYEYQPQIDQFSLTAVRHVRFDPFLGYYNTSRKAPTPTPDDIRRMVEQVQRQ